MKYAYVLPIALLAGACDDGAADPSEALDGAVTTDAAALTDAGCPEGMVPHPVADAAPPAGDAAPPAADAQAPADAGAVACDIPLRLRFEPLQHDATLSRATSIAFIPSMPGHFFVTDRDGGFAYMQLEGERARVLQQTAVPDVWVNGAAGLLGVAVDPLFANNRYFYLAVSVSNERNVIRRYTLEDTAEATLASEVSILEAFGPRAPRWHNIASIGFEDDDVMWALIGEKGLFEPAQDAADVLGKLVRFVPSRVPGEGGYVPAPGNPDLGEGSNPAVYATGLRSPWRGIHHEGKWYFGDVGFNDFEEVNVVSEPGQNFGWPLAEGPCQEACDGLTDPWFFYGRSNSHPFVAEDLDAVPTSERSVFVGWIYQPVAEDPYQGRWNDVMTFGDTIVGFIRARNIHGDGPDWAVGHLPWITGWAQAPDGYVYVTAMGTWPPADEGEAEQPSHILRAVLAD